MVARYLDPATGIPFYDGNAFRFIREGYYHYLEHKGNKSDPQVSLKICLYYLCQISHHSILLHNF